MKVDTGGDEVTIYAWWLEAIRIRKKEQVIWSFRYLMLTIPSNKKLQQKTFFFWIYTNKWPTSIFKIKEVKFVHLNALKGGDLNIYFLKIHTKILNNWCQKREYVFQFDKEAEVDFAGDWLRSCDWWINGSHRLRGQPGKALLFNKCISGRRMIFFRLQPFV